MRDAAIASVRASEATPSAAPRNAGVRREVLFSACRATEVAWESAGQGDFTRAALPLLASGVGNVSNRDFVRSVVEVFGQNRKQTPEFHGEEVLGGRILLGTASASVEAPGGSGGDGGAGCARSAGRRQGRGTRERSGIRSADRGGGRDPARDGRPAWTGEARWAGRPGRLRRRRQRSAAGTSVVSRAVSGSSA